MTLLRRQAVPPLPPAPDAGLLGYVIVTTTQGDRIGTTGATILDADTAAHELAQWHARGQARYTIAEVRVPDS